MLSHLKKLDSILLSLVFFYSIVILRKDFFQRNQINLIKEKRTEGVLEEDNLMYFHAKYNQNNSSNMNSKK